MCRPVTRSLGDAVPATMLANPLPELRRACSRPTDPLGDDFPNRFAVVAQKSLATRNRQLVGIQPQLM